MTLAVILSSLRFEVGGMSRGVKASLCSWSQERTETCPRMADKEENRADPTELGNHCQN